MRVARRRGATLSPLYACATGRETKERAVTSPGKRRGAGGGTEPGKSGRKRAGEKKNLILLRGKGEGNTVVAYPRGGRAAGWLERLEVKGGEKNYKIRACSEKVRAKSYSWRGKCATRKSPDKGKETGGWSLNCQIR